MSIHRFLCIVLILASTFWWGSLTVAAQGPSDITRLEGRIDRLNDRLLAVETAIDNQRNAIYDRDGILVVIGRHESQLDDLRSTNAATRTVILGAAASIGVQLLLIFLQTFTRKRNGNR